MGRRAIAVLVLFAALAPMRAGAESDAELAEAQQLFEQGIELSDSERWGEAVEYFRRSLAIAERPSTLFNLGVALYRLGRATEAAQTLERFREAVASSNDAATFASRVGEAEQILGELRAAIGQLHLVLDPPDARVLIDGIAVEGEGSPRTIAVDPGTHRLLVEAPGHERDESELSLLPGASTEREVRLTRLPEAPPSVVVVESRTHDAPADPAQDPWLWVGVAAGVLALTGAIIGIVFAAQPARDPFDGYEGSVGVTFNPLRVAF